MTNYLGSKYTLSPFEAWRNEQIQDLQRAIKRIGGTKKRQTGLAKKQVAALEKIIDCWQKIK